PLSLPKPNGVLCSQLPVRFSIILFANSVLAGVTRTDLTTILQCQVSGLALPPQHEPSSRGPRRLEVEHEVRPRGELRGPLEPLDEEPDVRLCEPVADPEVFELFLPRKAVEVEVQHI